MLFSYHDNLEESPFSQDRSGFTLAALPQMVFLFIWQFLH